MRRVSHVIFVQRLHFNLYGTRRATCVIYQINYYTHLVYWINEKAFRLGFKYIMTR